ncbi:MAG: tRNA (adenosine(37)-N6)-dimethylallyltransferase MiaA [Gammaproteobacteria bacterium]|nr:tRNA (adenosine(37)-N6)-dimethylallyltransferase MiaA [Gammaproteobacteria bacterium]MDH5239438.1 tRNA (adenosine(37)-N6)-dimethylallyltransferase MiaA [Gammaproteobacteria bacterium]MDH5260040.1 tRNA (adenosine(37)-N6)-dimethylallyltransferase MiaA [Gammaproteobacteria bacterium]MDH5582891.1 tRNA (adenosine(37)-N6)-dimethylallyltransferase MiaA [Gammaproteobacteria bacterium]
MSAKAILLMGPTASGKTDIAISLCKRFPCDVISVDSALVYRGMDIGTAKPDAQTLLRTPHQLIDIRDPEESYSAGDFVRDARLAIDASIAKGRIPLLVGGTMMYFRALTRGIADLPAGDSRVRKAIDEEASRLGWPAMHAELMTADPVIAARLNPNDSQRIQRALEVFRVSGKPLSAWQREGELPTGGPDYIKVALQIEPRKVLHERIEQRLANMIRLGFAAEVRTLRARPGLTRNSSSMRSVGYRQFWTYLEGECSADEARDRALYATRQLAKRQLTWLRSEQGVYLADPLEARAIDTISKHLADKLG